MDKVPQPTLITSLQNIMKLPVERGSDWGVIAYAINKDIVDDQGKVDDLRAVIFHLGSFYDQKEAEKHKDKVIELTGHSGIFVTRYAWPVPVTTNPDSDTVTVVNTDIKGKIVKMENDAFEEQKKWYDERLAFEKELYDESLLECDRDHLECYKRTGYLTIKHYLHKLALEKQLEEVSKVYEQRKDELQQLANSHPEYKEQFLPYFKEKLMKRGENDLYLRIEAGYNAYQHLFFAK
jgi:hypothetical protein